MNVDWTYKISRKLFFIRWCFGPSCVHSKRTTVFFLLDCMSLIDNVWYRIVTQIPCFVNTFLCNLPFQIAWLKIFLFALVSYNFLFALVSALLCLKGTILYLLFTSLESKQAPVDHLLPFEVEKSLMSLDLNYRNFSNLSTRSKLHNWCKNRKYRSTI